MKRPLQYFQSILLPLFTFLLVLSSCRKDELTLPAKVFFEFELITYEEGYNQKKGGPPEELPFAPPFNRMTIDRGTLVIESIAFDGRRDEGRDVYFSSDLEKPVIVDLERGKTNQEISFDIPQGIYNRVELLLDLGSEDNVSLVLEGSIRNRQSAEIPLRFEYRFQERIRIMAESGSQADKIVLKKDSPSRVRIVVDAGSIFQFANIGRLESTTIAIRDGDDEELLIISDVVNTNIFNSMVTRIENSFRIIFD